MIGGPVVVGIFRVVKHLKETTFLIESELLDYQNLDDCLPDKPRKVKYSLSIKNGNILIPNKNYFLVGLLEDTTERNETKNNLRVEGLYSKRLTQEDLHELKGVTHSVLVNRDSILSFDVDTVTIMKDYILTKDRKTLTDNILSTLPEKRNKLMCDSFNRYQTPHLYRQEFVKGKEIHIVETGLRIDWCLREKYTNESLCNYFGLESHYVQERLLPADTSALEELYVEDNNDILYVSVRPTPRDFLVVLNITSLDANPSYSYWESLYQDIRFKDSEVRKGKYNKLEQLDWLKCD